MATAARRLQWLLLCVSFSAVLRPTWTGRLNQIYHEGMRTGFWQPDGVDSASSVRGLNFPVWCLLVHYGSIETLAGRSVIRRMRRSGAHQPARHLLLSHGMITMQTPLEHFVIKRSAFLVFLGVGLYFKILLLACADVEQNPGPFTELEKLELKHHIVRESVKLEDVIAAVIEMGFDIQKYSKKIVALEAENSRLVSTVQELEKRLARQDKEQRRKNVVVFGVPTKTELNEAIDDILFKKLSLKKSSQEKLIEKAYRFGQDTPQRPILIRFNNESDKKRVMSLAPRLRSTKIKISEDLAMDERLTRRKIVEAHKAARLKDIDTKVMRQGLLVNGVILPPSDLDNTNWMEKYASQKDNATQLKFSEISPRANSVLVKDCPGAPNKKSTQR